MKLTPKLYLIESEERLGLVKIGFAGAGENIDENVVYERIKKYAVGISDTSTVHETPGAAVFEKYFHSLVSKQQKNIDIKFKALDKSYRPIEWFELDPEIAKILIDSFSKQHPAQLNDLNLEEIPLFLSGALSAIHWHAKFKGTSEQYYQEPSFLHDQKNIVSVVNFPAQENMMVETKPVEENQTQLNVNINFQENSETPATETTTKQTNPASNLPSITDFYEDIIRQIIDNQSMPPYYNTPENSPSIDNKPSPPTVTQSKENTDSFVPENNCEQLKIKLNQIEEIEFHRTIICITSTLVVVFLKIAMATPIALFFFILFINVVFIFWPYIQPTMSRFFIDTKNTLKKEAEKSRQRANK
jgi:hypothetical protein